MNTAQGTLINSWNLWKESIRLAFRFRKLITFSFLGILAFLVMASILGALAVIATKVHETFWMYPTVVGIAICIVCIFSLAMFFYGAMISAIYKGLTEQQISIRAGFRIAAQSAWSVMFWGIVFFFARYVIKGIGKGKKGLEGASALLNLSLELSSLLVVPVIVIEKKPVWPALQRAIRILSSTVVEHTTGPLVLKILGGILAAVACGGVFYSMLFLGEDVITGVGYKTFIALLLFVVFVLMAFLLLAHGIYAVLLYLQTAKGEENNLIPTQPEPTSTIPLRF